MVSQIVVRIIQYSRIILVCDSYHSLTMLNDSLWSLYGMAALFESIVSLVPRIKAYTVSKLIVGANDSIVVRTEIYFPQKRF